MPFPEHVLFSFGGLLTETESFDEIWQCNVRGVAQGQGYMVNIQTYLDEVAPALKSWFSGGHYMSASSSLQYLKVNNINPAGHYADPSTTFEHLYSPTQAGGDQAVAPAFTSIAYSFRTERSRGPGSHGRIYPPNFCSATINGGSAIGTQDVTLHRTAAHDLLALILNQDGTVGLTPCVVSGKAAIAEPITRVGIGTVYDFQSRRKNHAVEVYSFAAFP